MTKTFTKTFTMSDDQVDQIIIDELKNAIDMNLTLTKDDSGNYFDPDWKLVDAMVTVVQYYMPASEFASFKQNTALKKMVVHSELLGMYDDE